MTGKRLPYVVRQYRWNGTEIHADTILTRSEVALLFRVDPKTVTRWDKEGRLKARIRTLGGHRRWVGEDIIAVLTGGEKIEGPVWVGPAINTPRDSNNG